MLSKSHHRLSIANNLHIITLYLAEFRNVQHKKITKKGLVFPEISPRISCVFYYYVHYCSILQVVETLNKKINEIKILLCFGNPLQKSDY